MPFSAFDLQARAVSAQLLDRNPVYFWRVTRHGAAFRGNLESVADLTAPTPVEECAFEGGTARPRAKRAAA
ncbi:hypothetical protein SBBP1_530008 [Burkholderiales bacterium]|nr:hypothetical protein SBBP1_530008 [Burkholderiales bacterium]